MDTSIQPLSESDGDHLERRPRPIDIFFTPKAVAVIGATETPGSVGRNVIRNLVNSPFGGMVFPVNPKRPSVLGIKAYPNLAAVPAQVDLAIVITPAPTVPDVIAECAAAGVNGAIIISAGFRETGAAGAELERRVLDQARQANIRLLGPNCLGVMRPHSGLNAALASAMARPGPVAFISQSGALGAAILDWSLRANVGFSAFVSVGSMLDVGWGELIDYLGNDSQTRSIVIYLESIGDARSFLSAAREVALSKPIIVLKGGRTDEAARAAASHTGSLVGSDEALHAAFRRCGVLRVGSIDELFNVSDLLAKQPRPAGPRLTILTNAGGPGVLATDELLTSGGALAPLPPQTLAAIDQALPAHWSRNNPIDILGDAGPDRYAAAARLALQNPESDGLLVILTPQAMTDPTATAEQLQAAAKGAAKPLLASWMGGASVAEGEAILNRANIPTFRYPDTAARAFHATWRYSYNLRGLYETPILPEASGQISAQRADVEQQMEHARAAGRTLLTEVESKRLLAAYGIPSAETRAAASEDEAVRLAREIGYPVALKLLSETIAHKSDVGGVRLHLSDSNAVRRAYREIQAAVTKRVGIQYFLGVTVQPMADAHIGQGAEAGFELILGSSPDPQLGPVLLVGAGGQLVEALDDHALGLPPLTSTLARRMIERTRIFAALQGLRGRPPVDLAALEQLMVRFSQLVVEQRWIREIEINPLLVSSRQAIALDARVVLYGPEMTEQSLPRPAIRPYPTQYIRPYTLRSGAEVLIRPIRPEDEPLIVAFHGTLSEQSVYLRYFYPMSLEQRIAHERLTRICFIDYDREMVLVAERADPSSGQRAIIGVGRLTKLRGANEAEFATVVSDAYHGQGLGSELLRRLIAIGRDERLDRVVADVLPDNRDMQQVFKKLGFRFRRILGEPIRVELDL
ncbi:MAG TPA: bifunctional acetate--CoA ligase family protein/GNAT family N-acetyltransferase [Roseiflexaceae bacterium]|nr:bifunctional acetate--CoA ligase family protein/GNAT family N-acetyltransferase [Roseiflexaceae bacterium]